MGCQQHRPTLVPRSSGPLCSSRMHPQGRQFRDADQADRPARGQLTGCCPTSAPTTQPELLADPGRALANGGTITNTVANQAVCCGSGLLPQQWHSGFRRFYDAIERIARATSRNIDLDTVQADRRLDCAREDRYTDATAIPTPALRRVWSARGLQLRLQKRRAPGAISAEWKRHTVDPTNPSSLVFDFASLHQILNDDRESYGTWTRKRSSMRGVQALKFGIKRTITSAISPSTHYLRRLLKPINTLSPDCSPGFTRVTTRKTSRHPLVDAIGFPTRARSRASCSASCRIRTRVVSAEQLLAQEKTTGGSSWEISGRPLARQPGRAHSAHNQITSGGYRKRAGAINSPFGSYLPTTADRSYTDTLPSLNVAYDVSHDIVVRFARRKSCTTGLHGCRSARQPESGALTGSPATPTSIHTAQRKDLSIECTRTRYGVYARNLLEGRQVIHRGSPVSEVFPIQTQTPQSHLHATSTPNCSIVRSTSTYAPTAAERSGRGAGTHQADLGGFGVQANYTYSDASLTAMTQFRAIRRTRTTSRASSRTSC